MPSLAPMAPMGEGGSGPASPISGLVSHLAEALPDVQDAPPAAAPPAPARPRKRALVRSALIAQTSSGGPPPSPAAMRMADQILVASQAVPTLGWRLNTAQGVVALTSGSDLIIGRLASAGATILVPATIVSKAHCRVWLEGPTALVEDLGSSNGTIIRRQGRPFPVQGPSVLIDGDELMVLDEVVLATVSGAPA